MKRIKYGKEPVLHVHNYICLLITPTGKGPVCKMKYLYCTNLKEVKKRKTALKKGQILEVYKAEHNFKEAWQK